MSALVAVVPAPDWATYRPLRARIAADVVRSEPCACGGRVVQLRGQDVAVVVASHNTTTQHRTWRSWRNER